MIRKLIAPSKAIASTWDREKAKLLSALLLVRIIALAGIVLMLVVAPTDTEALHHSGAKLAGGALGFNLLAYLISRSRHYKLGCWLINVETIIGVTSACFLDDSASTFAGATAWYGISILMSGLILPLQHTLWVTVATTLIFASLGFHITKENYSILISNFTYFLASSALVIIGAVMRSKTELVLDAERAALAQSSKLSSLGEMAGGVAHEINNPLAVLQNISGQISELIDEEEIDRDLIKKMAATLTKTVERIAKIVKGLRSFSRNGNQDPFETASIKNLVDDTLSFCRERFKLNSVELIVEPISENLKIDCRPTEISQVMLNLLNNAYDAVSKSGERWVKISTTEAETHVEIRISDSGEPIKPEIQQRLFQPFYTTKEIGKGTGLGLSISMGIILSHHGEIKFEAQQAHTCFLLRLPKALKPSAAMTKEAITA